MNEQLEELQRRIIKDIKGTEKFIVENDLNRIKKAEARGEIDGMKIALFEISALDKPYVGSNGK